MSQVERLRAIASLAPSITAGVAARISCAMSKSARHPSVYSILRFLIGSLLLPCPHALAEPVAVRHVEGVTFGFLTLRNLDGQIIAYGTLKQVADPKEAVLVDDLHFEFKDGSEYREITKFTQKGTFRLVSNQLLMKGPSFKQQSESWIDARSGKITFRELDKKGKETTKQLQLPADVSNGLLFIVAKNLDPSAESVVSMVNASDKPRVVKLRFAPAQGKTFKLGALSFKAQHYVMKVKIEGAAGVIAPIVGKQPADSHFYTLKSEAPTFLEFEGPLSADGPVWRIELTQPDAGSEPPRPEERERPQPEKEKK